MIASLSLLAITSFMFIKADHHILKCQQRRARLQCEAGSYIQVVDAFYGRDNKEDCRIEIVERLWSTNCKAHGANSIVREKCNGHQQCVVKASDSVFQDPCFMTYKFLRIHYRCAVNGKYGPWGNFSECSKLCGRGSKTRSRQCDSPSPKNGGKECYGPSNDTVMCNTNPCPVNGEWGQWSKYGSCSQPCGGGVKIRTRECNNPSPKYGGRYCDGNAEEHPHCNEQLCTAPPLKTEEKTVCEGREMELFCRHGRKLRITDAMYGRLTKNICWSFFNVLWSTNCNAASSLEKVSKLCNGKDSCRISATNHFFGEPCKGTSKYLKVEYICVY